MNEVERNDVFNTSADLFANSSSETVMENVDFSAILLEPQKQFEKLKNENLKFVDDPMTDCEMSVSSINSCTRSAQSALNMIADQIVSEASDTLRLFCPFCHLDFKFDFILKNHIESNHSEVLKKLTASDQNLTLPHACPYCYAKFYTQELLPNHILRKHHESVIQLCAKEDTSTFIYCKFCPHKVQREHFRMFLIHTEKKHFKSFNELIRSKFFTSCVTSDNFNSDVPPVPEVQSPHLSEGFSKLMADELPRKNVEKTKNVLKLNLKSNVDSPLKSILKNSPAKFSLNDASSYDNVNNLSVSVSVRRKLRFDIPAKESDSPNSGDSWEYGFHKSKKLKVNDENDAPLSHCKSKKWYNFFKKKPMKGKKLVGKRSSSLTNIATSTPVDEENARPLFMSPNSNHTPIFASFKWKDSQIKYLSTRFKCGLCLEGFNNNVYLVEHLRKQHHGLKFQPQYRCGECEAKFYRNSYLMKHSQIHHSTPFCMTTTDKSF